MTAPFDPNAGNRCKLCDHRVHMVDRHPPAGCYCGCHTEHRSQRAEADAHNRPHDPHALPIDPEVDRLRHLADVLADHAAASVPDRPQADETFQRVRHATQLADRALSYLTGVTDLPEGSLLDAYPPLPLDLTPAVEDPDGLRYGHDGLL